jgi:HPr kinase/phosphorylase
MLLHGSCAALAGEGVLLIAPPGGGKSDLLLRLIGRGWRLVADDQVSLSVADGGPVAAPPAALAGALEVRGLGLLVGLDWACAPLRAPERWRAAGADLPLLHLDPWGPAAPDLLAMALHVLAGRTAMRAGAFAA